MKKEWWTVRAPGMFSKRDFTISPVNQTAGEKLASDNIKAIKLYEKFGFKKIDFLEDEYGNGIHREFYEKKF